MSEKVVNIDRRATPKTNMIDGMIQRSWKTEDALAELIDNSFGEGRGNAHSVHIRYRPDEGEHGLLEIWDDGRGMDDLKDLFTLGQTVGRVGKDIGRYGSGGSQAIVWLAHKVEVISIRKSDGKTCSYKAIWSDWQKGGDWPEIPHNWETVDMYNVPYEDMRRIGHGVMIRLWLRRGLRPESQRAKVAERYSPALRHNKIITWETTGKNARYERIVPVGQAFEYDDYVLEEAIVETPKGKFVVEVEAYFAMEPTSEFKAGMNVEFADLRVVIGRDKSQMCFWDRHNNKPMSYSNISGRVVLGKEWLEYLTTNKEDFNNDLVKTAFYDAVFTVMKPLLNKAQDASKFAGLSQLSAMFNDILAVDLPLEMAGDHGDDLLGKDSGGNEETIDAAGKWPERTKAKKARKQGEAHPETERKYPWMKPTDIKREGSKTKRRVMVGGSPRAIMTLERWSDEDMHGQWCFVECNGALLYGYINEACSLIMDGMDKSATSQQKQTMMLAILPELAMAIASDEEFARYVFPKQFQNWKNLEEDDSRVSIRRLIQVELAKRTKMFVE